MNHWGVIILIILSGCISTNSRFEYAEVSYEKPVRYSPTGINGYVKSNQEKCASNGKTIVMLFGKEGNVWSEEALRILMEAVKPYSKNIFIEQWTGSAPPDRQALFEAFNPTKSYPTIIIGCEYVKVGSGGDHDRNVEELKQILELAI